MVLFIKNPAPFTVTALPKGCCSVVVAFTPIWYVLSSRFTTNPSRHPIRKTRIPVSVANSCELCKG